MCHSVHSKPALTSVTAQLPSGQDGLHGRHAPPRLLLAGLLEEGEGQQDAGTGLGRRLRAAIEDASQGDVTEPLRQFEAPGPAEIEVMTAARRRQAEPGGTVPEETERIWSLEVGKLQQRIQSLQWQRQAQHTVVRLALRPHAQSALQQIAEVHRCGSVVACGRHQDGCKKGYTSNV